MCAIAPKVGFTNETLRRWVREAEREAGERPGPTRSATARLQVLARENRELKRANESLREVSAFDAAAERGDDEGECQAAPRAPRAD